MITVALAGLMAVQLVLLNIAWDLKDLAFERNVVTALTMTARNLEAGEIAGDALEVIYRIGAGDSLQPRIHRYEFHTTVGEGLPNYPVQLDSTIIGIDAHLTGPMACADSVFTTQQLTLVMSQSRSDLIQRIVGDLVVQEPRSIGERLRRSEIDSLLRFNLDEVGIYLVPDFGVIAAGSDSVLLASADRFLGTGGEKLRASRFRTLLFPLDLTPGAFELALHFPGQRGFLLKQVWPLLAASILFVAVIIAAFILTLGTVDRQRRLADRMVDFINNMTHEFKTPISTVSLASEAIDRADILEQPEALRRYNRMIRDENLRMRRQVEKILQIAQVEAGDFHLNLTTVDLHELATGTAETFALQIEKRQGALKLDLAARKSLVRGDPVHLGNVLANLIDNAIKYSPAAPVVGLKTSNRGGCLVLEVSDQGVGIERTDHARVFEKYYRCPTGDRHDVKGFGLGLSFVRLLAKAHGGTVELDSEPGHGTSVTLSLPLAAGGPRPGSGE